jgi:hypothetical protein
VSVVGFWITTVAQVLELQSLVQLLQSELLPAAPRKRNLIRTFKKDCRKQMARGHKNSHSSGSRHSNKSRARDKAFTAGPSAAGTQGEVATALHRVSPEITTPEIRATVTPPTRKTSIFKLSLVPLVGAYIASFAMWQDKAGNVVTGLGLGGWGDLLFHIRAAIFFGEQGGWPHESFFLAGQPIGYAFVADFISALLWRAGFSTATAFAVPTIVLVACFLGALEWVVLKMTKSVSAAILSAILFMCFGGLSGWSILPELSPDSWTKLRNLPHGITVWREANYAVLNPFVMMMHQRAFLLGFPLFVGLLYLSWRFLLEKSLTVLAILSFAAILLALFHPFTWVSFLLIFPSWMAWMIILGIGSYTRREIAWTAGALAITGLVGFLIVKTLQPSAGASSITWRPGWLATDINWIYFWLKNIGLYFVLGFVAVYYFFPRNAPLALLVLAGITPFVAANLFQFAPWDWDNTKIFAPVWIILCIAVGSFIASLWEESQLGGKVIAIAVLPMLVLSGGLEVARVVTFRSQPMTIVSVADRSMGEAVRDRVGKRDLMLSEPEASHPIFMLSGRPSFVAYEGWLWSQGWKGKYEQRMIDKQVIYRGSEAARELIQKNQIAYVVVGPPELRAGANKKWFDSTYQPLLFMNDYTIYDVRQSKQLTMDNRFQLDREQKGSQ